ncbi:MAG TPA: NADH dehydrogenase (quinone) subunit D [Nitrospirales bacterium]|nr:NADH dehydrogenase (quinone) subunit D [Nitrospirales bacterium]HIB54305.1 NADH dehydrogenase (quinone) subunit D [Nitrospirales bacterium]HIC05043.1 NADH dehydrogenase (quinone) subunit D [Nitrospirales bacterium]HIO70143.1 NADH dehydrogenase (quinone) subunit D [Nitrospirales bacterium]
MSQGLKDQRTSVYRVDPESPGDPALPVLRTEELMLNMGPQHPATHGVLKVVMDLEGERIVKATPVMGYLHRGVEKLAEHGTYHQFIPHTDRLDYVCAMYNNFAYVRAVEKLIDLPVPERAEYLRTIVAEIQRIIGHQFWLGTQSLDLGAMTVFFYTFRDREILLDWFDRLCGARLTTSWYRIGGVEKDFSPDLVETIYEYLDYFPPKIDEYMIFLEKNRIWLARTKGVAVISAEDAISFGMSGPPLRGSGVDYDLRKYEPYAAYDKVEWKVPVGTNGDTYDRYWIRIEEMRESVKIIRQCLDHLKELDQLPADDPRNQIMAKRPSVTLPTKDRVFTSLENMIQQFKLFSDGFKAPKGEIYCGTEAHKGELGFYIVSDGDSRPYRMKIRAPSFIHMGAFNHMCKGYMIADAVTIFGTYDVVMGECDR